jgi:hypothetical protein
VGRRTSDKNRDDLLAFCLHRDGDIDLHLVLDDDHAGRKGGDFGPVKDATLDHLDGNPTNHDPTNVVRVERSSNSREGNYAREGGRGGLGRLLTPQNVAEARAKAAAFLALRAPAPGPRGTGQGQGDPGSPEAPARWISDVHEEDRDQLRARINFDRMQPEYRLWVYEQVRDNGSITKADAIVAGAEFVQQETGKGTKKTTLDYFDTICSRTGWLREAREAGGRLVWEFRKERDIEAIGKQLAGRVKTLRDLLAGGAS